MENDNERIKKKLKFFQENKIKIHIKKKDKTFLNGTILKKENDEVYLIDENRLGELYIFLEDIYDVQQFTEGGKR